MFTFMGLAFAFLLLFFGFLTIQRGEDGLGTLEWLVAALVLGLTLGRFIPF